MYISIYIFICVYSNSSLTLRTYPVHLPFRESKLVYIMVSETVFIFEFHDSRILLITVSYKAQKKIRITRTSKDPSLVSFHFNREL